MATDVCVVALAVDVVLLLWLVLSPVVFRWRAWDCVLCWVFWFCVLVLCSGVGAACWCCRVGIACW